MTMFEEMLGRNIQLFLDNIEYKKWKGDVTSVVVRRIFVDNEFHIGKDNFHELAKVLDDWYAVLQAQQLAEEFEDMEEVREHLNEMIGDANNGNH